MAVVVANEAVEPETTLLNCLRTLWPGLHSHSNHTDGRGLVTSEAIAWLGALDRHPFGDRVVSGRSPA